MSRLVLICALLGQAFSLEVKTSQGTIRGSDVETPYGPVTSFLGVPFAEPPTGPLRFEAPRPPQLFSTVYNATEKKLSCPGINLDLGDEIKLDFGKQDEDCLYLNLWAPANASNLPIVLYVHGGGFVTGSGGYFAYDGTRLAARANVVYITVNMRLGPFGFLQLPGLAGTNVGLLDLIRALHWIRENAAAFGGNTEQVTLWGQSAGAMAIDFLLKSNAVNGLVRRAILQGGCSGAANIFLRADGQYASQQLAYAVGCYPEESDPTPSRGLLSCLRDVPWQEIIAKLSSGNFLDRASIQPFVDHKLIRSDVVASPKVTRSVEKILVLNDELEGFTFMQLLFKKLYQTDDISSTDWMSALMVMFKLILHTPYKATKELFQSYVPHDLTGAEVLDGLREIELRKRLGHMFTDPIFFCPAEHRAATASDEGVRVYRGEFHFRADFSFLPEWASMTHAEEIPYMHGNLDLYKPGVEGLAGAMLEGFVNTTESDFKFSDEMIELLQTFFHGR